MSEEVTNEVSDYEMENEADQTVNDYAAESDGEQTEFSEGEPVTSNDEDGDDSSAAPKNGVQKRIDELTRLRYEAQREADYWKQQAQTSKPEPVVEQVDKEPDLEDYDDYEQYIKDLSKYTVRQERKAAEESNKSSATQQSFAKAVEDFRSKNPDYDIVVNNPSLPISKDMAEVIMLSEVGPQLAYHLGKNPGEAARISGLSPIAAARELGKMEAKLSLPQTKKTPSAPDPVKPVPKGSGGAVKSPDDMSPEEYREWRWQRINNR